MDRMTGLWTRANGRRGATLPEVLISLVVLAVGLTAVIALFPVGINRVRNAVLDTRTTQMAKNAIETFHLKRMYNDEFIVNWRAHDVQFVKEQLNQSPLLPSAQVLDRYIGNDFGGGPNIPLPQNQYSYPPFAPPALNAPNTIGGWDINLPNPGVTSNVGDAWRYYLNASQSKAPEDPSNVADDGFGAMSAASPGFNMSYPILLDPWLFDHMWFTVGLVNGGGGVGVPRINIATPLSVPSLPGTESYYGDPVKWAAGGFTQTPSIAPFCDITVATTSELFYLPQGTDRDMVKTRWFASLSDVEFSDATPGQPRNPSSQDFLQAIPNDAITPTNYLELGSYTNLQGQGVPRPTSLRTYDFTWGAMIQRRLVEDPSESSDPINDPAVARPSSQSRAFAGKVAILCFYRRNVTQPYTIVEGCFYNGSRKVTLSWPITGMGAPTIKAGVWLCEVSVARDTSNTVFQGACNRSSAVYPKFFDPNPPTEKYLYRRAFKFYKVLEVAPQEVATGPNGLTRTYQEVVVDRAAAGYPVNYARLDPANAANVLRGTDAAPDQRPRDWYQTPTWPIRDSILTGSFDDETNISQANLTGNPAYSPYYPVIIFDGLREVFEYEY